MPNPAEGLYTLLMQWQIPAGSSARQQRGAELTDDEFWRLQSDAFGLLQDVQLILDGLAAEGRDVSPYQEAVPSYWEAVACWSTGWTTPHPNGYSSIEYRDARDLRSLGAFLDSLGINDLPSAESLAALAEQLNAAAAVIQNDGRIDTGEAAYLTGLVERARRAMSRVETTGTLPVRRVATELSGAMLAVVAQEPEQSPRRKLWLKVAGKVAATVAAFGVSFGAGLAVAYVRPPQPIEVTYNTPESPQRPPLELPAGSGDEAPPPPPPR